MFDEEIKLGRWMEAGAAGRDTGPADLARWDQMLTNAKLL